MLRFWWEVVLQSFLESIAFSGENWQTILFAIIVLAITFLWSVRNHGWKKGIKFHLRRTIGETLVIIVVAWGVVFLVYLVHTPYSMYRGAVARATSAEATSSSAQKELADKTTKIADLELRLQNLPSEKAGPRWVKDLQFEVPRQREPESWEISIYSFQETIQPVRLRLACDSYLVGAVTNVKMRTGADPAQEVIGPWWKIADKGRAIELGYDGPALNMMNMLSVQIHSTVPIRVLNVERWKTD